jgi:hypothetical protein
MRYIDKGITMKPMLGWLALIAVFSLAACSLFRKEEDDIGVYRDDALDHATPHEAAGKALGAFQGKLDGNTVHALGFGSLAEAKAAKLGEPWPKFELKCEDVLAYDSARTPDFKSLAPFQDLLYPIQGKDEKGVMRNRSLVFLGRIRAKDTTGKEGNWRPQQMGGGRLMQRLDSTIASLPADRRSGLALAEIPALGAVFLASEADGKQMLIPALMTGPAKSCSNLELGRGLPAKLALAQLSKCFNGSTVCGKFEIPPGQKP